MEKLIKRRIELANQIEQFRKKFSENGDKWADEEERGNWEKLNADYDAVCREIDEKQAAADVHSRADQIRESQQQPLRSGEQRPGLENREPGERRDGDAVEVTERNRALALSAWCRYQLGHDLDERHVEACRLTGIRPSRRHLEFLLPTGMERTRRYQQICRSVHHTRAREEMLAARDLSAFDMGSGGALVPETLVRQLEVNMLAFGGMRQVAETLVTQTGEQLSWPTADDTSNTGEQLGEATSIGSSTDPNFERVVWNAYKFSSKPIKVPYELLEDAVIDLPGVLGAMLGERLGRITNTKYTTGTGDATPKGLITAATVGRTAASATAITYDDIHRLKHSVDPAYRMGASFMMHDSIVLAVKLLKDGEGRYLWQSGARDGTPDRLEGDLVTVNQDMASSMEASADVLVYGQLSKYKIRRVRSVRMYRLEERYRDTDEDGFIALIREDGNLLDAGTAPVKKLRMGS